MPPPVEHSGDGRDGEHTDARVCEGGVGSAIGRSDTPSTRHVENGAAHELRHHRKEPGVSCYAVRASSVAVASPHQYSSFTISSFTSSALTVTDSSTRNVILIGYYRLELLVRYYNDASY